jgi:hypothetical protein
VIQSVLLKLVVQLCWRKCSGDFVLFGEVHGSCVKTVFLLVNRFECVLALLVCRFILEGLVVWLSDDCNLASQCMFEQMLYAFLKAE